MAGREWQYENCFYLNRKPGKTYTLNIGMLLFAIRCVYMCRVGRPSYRCEDVLKLMLYKYYVSKLNGLD